MISQSDFQNLVGNRIFTVEFEKADGTIRVLNGKLGVTKHLRGGHREIPNDMIVVFDMILGEYRSFYLDRVRKLRFDGGEEWTFENGELK